MSPCKGCGTVMNSAAEAPSTVSTAPGTAFAGGPPVVLVVQV